MSREVRVKIPEPQYTLFDVKREGKVEIVVVNEALLAFRHLDVFPWHLRITIDAKDVVDNGMPSPAESKVLDRLGDKLEASVLAGRNENGAQNAIFVARSTWDGVRELMYQVHDPEVADAALQSHLKRKRPVREWGYRMTRDPEWKDAASLFQLFPQANGVDA